MGGGSDDEVATMINDHYAGLIDVAEYWQIGDIRTITLNAIASGTTGEAQSSQNVQLVIIGIKHDDKADGSGKATITVQTKDCLGAGGMINAPSSGYNYSLWAYTSRRTWCNNDFKSALPTWLQNLIKPVAKVTNRHAHTTNSNYGALRGQTTTTDSVFLLSEFETFGTSPFISMGGDVGSDGTQYEYMKTQSNRIKGGPSQYWWLRSSIVSSAGTFDYATANSDGTAYYATMSYGCGIAPAFCL
jgi:hypothetical protein